MEMKATWDGKPIAPEPPFGASIVVYRRTGLGIEYLILHRAHEGPDYEVDWDWTPPSGARQPDESIDTCAVRELSEEAGLTARLRRVSDATVEWAVYVAEVSDDAVVTLHDAEHDRFEWVRLVEALSRCRPRVVADGIALAARHIGDFWHVRDRNGLEVSIAFRPLEMQDLPLMHKWLNEPLVNEWYWANKACSPDIVQRI